MSFDSRVMEAVADHRAAWATAVADAVMRAGTTPLILVSCALVGLVAAVRLRALRAALAVLAALVVAVLAADGLKTVFGRPRPPHQLALVWVHGDAFPSTHAAATSAVVVAFLVAYPWRSPRSRAMVGGALAALLVLVGACMVYVGAHWLTDVLAGWLLGGTIGLAVGRASRWSPRRDPAPEPTWLTR